jgi:hypothetical protein
LSVTSACGGCYRTAELFGAITRAGEPVFQIGAHGAGHIGHFLGALLDHVIDLGLDVFGRLLAAFAGQEQSGADQQQGRRDRAEQAPHRVGDRRTDRCHLQRIVLGPALDRLHHAFALFAHIVPDSFLICAGEMRVLISAAVLPTVSRSSPTVEASASRDRSDSSRSSSTEGSRMDGIG